MLNNYLKITLRTIQKHKGYTFINVLGLAVGMATCLLILLFVRHERSYDRFHEQAGQIYQLAWYAKSQSPDQARVNMPSALGPVLEREVPEVVHALRLATLWGDALVGNANEQFYESGFYFADANFFEVFSFRLLRGNPETALSRPYTLVLTAPTAEKYFGAADPIGQTLTLNNEHTFEITGVVEAPPSNSHLQFNILASYESRGLINPRQQASWLGLWDLTYALLRPDAAPESIARKLEGLVVAHMGAAYGEQGTEQGEKMAFLAQPITDLHLYGLPAPQADVRLLYLFSAVGLLVLLIACINYMNLSTARYADRAREVGVRKAAGAGRLQLVRQFLSESVLLSLLALGFAVALAEFFLPSFNALTDKALTIDYAGEPLLPLAFVGLALLIGVLAGSYPAFFLSSFKPVDVLKGTRTAGAGGVAATLRKGLVVFQFAISVALIISTLAIQRQLDYVRSKPLGFSTEQAIVIPTKNHLGTQYEVFKRELLQHPNVRRVTTSSGVPANPSYIGYFITPEGNPRQSVTAYAVDPDFVETLGMDLAAGRDFSADLATDAAGSVLINEEAARAFGWAEPLGKQISLSEDEVMTVVGVVEDFHYQSLKEAITPVIFHLTDQGSRFVTVRLSTNELPGTLAFVGAAWNRLLPEWPFEYSFLDADYARLYTAEQRLARIFGLFSALAIGIACLGLFGLAAFTAGQRTKEIGIRKVLGASVTGLILLLSRDFARLVLVAFVAAAPVAYLAMDHWLNEYVYRIEISWGIFLIAGLAALGVALLTVSYHAARAALSDPVDSLRYE